MSAVRFGAYVGLAVLGLLVGVAGSLVQGGWFPGGLLLGLLGIAALSYGAVKVTRSRIGAGAAAGGWLIAVLLLTAPRPEGDFVFGAGLGSYVFLLGGMLVAVICTTLPHPPSGGGQITRLGK